MKKILALLLVLALALSLAACGGSAKKGDITVTDMTGREVTVTLPVTRVVALQPADCEILYAIGAGDAVVGRGEYCDSPAEVLDIPSVQSGYNTNTEQIIALEPQVLFMSTMAQSEEQIESLENAGVKVVVTETTDIQGVYNAITEDPNFSGDNALPMGSVDIDQVDVTNMQNHPEIWMAAGTTDWTMNGEIAMRLLLLEIAGEYDKIYDPASGEYGVDVVEVPGTAIMATSLKETSTVENLGEIAGETYGNLGYLSVADWMPADLIH